MEIIHYEYSVETNKKKKNSNLCRGGVFILLCAAEYVCHGFAMSSTFNTERNFLFCFFEAIKRDCMMKESIEKL